MSAITRQPVAAVIRCASSRPRSESPPQPISSTTASPRPLRNARAASSTWFGAACGVGSRGSASATTPPGFHDVSDGRISVATWPGAICAACTAAAASAPTVATSLAVRTQPETPRAQPSVSAVSGGSFGR